MQSTDASRPALTKFGTFGGVFTPNVLTILGVNTVLVGWSDDAVKQTEFARTIRHILELKRNLLVFGEADVPEEHLRTFVDVWWRAKENGSFMLTLAHLLHSSRRWRDHTLRVLRIVEDEAGREQAAEATRQMVREARFDAEVQVMVSTRPPLDEIVRQSEFSAVCFVGLSLQAVHETENPLADYTALAAGLKGNFFLAKSWHDLEL